MLTSALSAFFGHTPTTSSPSTLWEGGGREGGEGVEEEKRDKGERKRGERATSVNLINQELVGH